MAKVNSTRLGTSKFITPPTRFGSVVFVVALLLLFAPLASPSTTGDSLAARPADFNLNEGDTVSATGSDDPDIYIVNEHGYKRLFLNPIIFSFYGHLGGFSSVKSISGDVRSAFPTSSIFRNCEADAEEVYAVEVSGEDTGTLHHVSMSGDQAVAEDEEFFRKVFCINNNEFNWYPKGSDYTSVSQVPIYSRNVASSPFEAPGALRVDFQETYQIVLSWDPVHGATHYSVKRREKLSNEYIVVAREVKDTAYSDLTVLGGLSYSYIITASNPAGESGPSSVVDAVALRHGGGLGGRPTGGSDTIAPTVSVTAPSGDATVSGSSVTLSASASDNSGVNGVQFAVDGTNVGTEDMSSPYSITWDSTTVADGFRSVTASAIDTAGNRATSTSVTITVDNTPPSAPTLSVSVDSATEITLTITLPDEGEDELFIYRSTTSGQGSGGTLIYSGATKASHVDTGLSSGTTYYYTAYLEDASDNLSSGSAEVSDTPLGAPSVTTNTATSVTETTATLNGTLDIGDEDTAQAFFRWREVGAGSFTETTPQELTASGSFNQGLTGLTASTSYEYKAVVTWNEGADEDEGELVEFTTQADTTAPTPGNSGTITTASVGSSGLTLNWTKATDDISAQGALEYRVYQSDTNNIDTVENAEANGTPLNSFTADIATFDVSGLTASTSYFFNVIVQDEVGNKAAYAMVEEATAPLALVTDGLVAFYLEGVEGSGDVLTDSSGNENHGQLGSTAGVDTNDPAWVTEGLGFVTDDRVTTPVVNAFGDFTIMVAFVDNEAVGAGTNFERLVDKSFSAGAWLGRNGTVANTWGGGVKETVGPFGRYVTLSDGSWHTITSRRNATTHNIIGDRHAVTASGTVTNSLLSADALWFGTANPSGGPLGGSIAYALIYDRALTDTDIEQNYDFIKSELAGRGITLP